MSHYGDSSSKKRIATIGVSSLILVVIGVAATVGITKNQNEEAIDGGSEVTASNKAAITGLCKPTDYKDACMESLQSVEPNVTDPRELIKVGFDFTRKKLTEIMDESTTLKEAEKDPIAKQALSVCKDMMKLAINHLQQSFEKIGVFDITKLDDLMADLQTWLSSVITYQGTCFDGFENVTSPAAPKIKEAINNTMKLSSNALVMVQQLSDIFKSLDLPDFNTRRLLQENDGELPVWLDSARRKLLVDDTTKPNLVIAKDGSGDHKTFAEAIKALPRESMTPFVVQVKAGVYQEKVLIPISIWNITWIGEGSTTTKVSFNQSLGSGILTYYTSTFTLQGAGHTFKNIGFENPSGADKHSAVAIAIDGDRTAFFNCRFDGYENTLYSHSNRQFYRGCTITGTVDFIFGDAQALFQNCLILITKPIDNQVCSVASSEKVDTHSVTGLVFQNCTITGDESYLPVKADFESYLGRTWKDYSTVIYMQSFISNVINPEGWTTRMGSFGTTTCFFAEVNNRGPGSNTSQRVTWQGIKKLSPTEALEYTGEKFLMNDAWITSTGIPYERGMITM
ncbi:hypothetical protein SAY87_010497 [Trapa incisa]|uniref:Pectinesterase n=1 Tax=Trapa incisa TaxID=236973 RepID=A0AAN7GEA0_9MYRT|nr:hypothetical protein SAY87_010497 [Trapa incisa]